MVDPRWRNLAEDSIVGFVIFSIALMLNAMVQRGISRLPFAMAGLSRTLTRLIVFGIGLLILLRFWGISITPILTALGVGGLEHPLLHRQQQLGHRMGQGPHGR